MSDIGAGLALLLEPRPLLWLVTGLALGFVVGVLPGLSTSNTAALLLPFSIGLPIEESLILIVSIYAGAAYGGAIPAILINVPGEAGAAVTALDGYPMAKRGQGGLAIGIARMASVLGGVVSGVVVLLVLAPLGDLALKFGTREMLVVILIGFVVSATLIGDSPRKGLLSGVIGLLLATIGGSPISGQTRFTFGTIELYEGIPFIAALIGLFAISEMMLSAKRSGVETVHVQSSGSGFREQLRDALHGVTVTLRRPLVVAQSTVIGAIIGVMPGLGNAVSNFISYAFAKRQSKHPETFGTGEPDGIIASEACDNAGTSASLVPTLTLGIPGSATMAVVLAALYLQGIQPGPRVLVSHAPEVYAVLWAAIAASLLILPFGLALAAPLTLITRVAPAYLVPGVLFACLAGAFAGRNNVFDVGLTVAFGVIGLVLRQNGYPVIPMVLGLILGPLAEDNLVRSLELGRNQLSYYFGSVTVNVLWGLLLVLLVYLVLQTRRKRLNREEISLAAEKDRSR